MPSDKERLRFYYGAILRFDPKMDGSWKARQIYYSRSKKTFKRFVASIDAAMRQDRRRAGR